MEEILEDLSGSSFYITRDFLGLWTINIPTTEIIKFHKPPDILYTSVKYMAYDRDSNWND